MTETFKGAALSDADIEEIYNREFGLDEDWKIGPLVLEFSRALIAADRRLTAELRFVDLTAEQGGADLRDVLIRNGFVECDIAACNCGSWHARHGYPERFQEFKDMLSDAGHPTCNDNGNLASKALAELIAERDALRAALTTQPQAEPRKDGSISFEEAQDLARRHAKAEPESYYSEPFEPHLWVINAIVEASATWYERAVQERVRRVKAEAATAQPQAEPADARIYWHASQGWQVEWLTHAPNGGQNNYYRRATPPSEAT